MLDEKVPQIVRGDGRCREDHVRQQQGLHEELVGLRQLAGMFRQLQRRRAVKGEDAACAHLPRFQDDIHLDQAGFIVNAQTVGDDQPCAGPARAGLDKD